ncbi:MAG TPA: response regulator transcription factor [Pyrinomonadaceae bacterium]|nr:response regulator transcription factor [Pyrinomonadaceae bacterium]
MARARILLADDHKEMCNIVVELLEREFEILDTVGDGCALLKAADGFKPDVCLLDISMPTMNGIEAAIQLRERGSTAKVIFLTIHEDTDFIQAALRIGASGYVFKRRVTSDLKHAVSEALEDRIFVSPTYR